MMGAVSAHNLFQEDKAHGHGSYDAHRNPAKKMKVAVAGLGTGAVAVVRAMESAPNLELVAAADIRPRALTAFQQRFGGRAYDSVEKLCDDPDVEVVWISTPNQFHCEHTLIAARGGKNVVVEKPMAMSLEEADLMVEAAEKHKVKLLCGHTASLMAANRRMRQVVASGELGKICAINVWSYSDWMFRPRMPQEVDLATGGGVPYRQGPHQIDTVRLLGGGLVRSVRAQTGQWFPARKVPGYYAAFLEFEDGTPATAVHNGYGYFSTFEFVPWAGSRLNRGAEERRRALRADPASAEREAADKDEMRFGGSKEGGMEGGPQEVRAPRTGFQGDLGIVITSCQLGDIRQAPNGLWIYDDNGQREVPVEGIHDERMGELDEMYDAVQHNRPVAHDGRWGMATLEVVLAIMQSGRERREISMTHQCPSYE